NLVNGFAGHFFERRDPFRDFGQTAAAQCEHAPLDCLSFQFQGGSADEHQFLDFVVYFHDFVKSAAALVTCVVAGSTAFALADFYGFGLFGSKALSDQSFLWDLDFFRAVLADAANQSLRANQVDRGRNQEGFNTHVHEAGNGLWGAVGMQCGKHQVACESGLNGDFRSFKVADFTDKNDVRI